MAVNPVGAFHLMQPIVGLESQTVRRELLLADEQQQKENAVLEKAREARAKVGSGRGVAKLSKEERRTPIAEMLKALEAANAMPSGPGSFLP